MSFNFSPHCRSIEWDLEDLEDTIKIVEKNPSKFRMDSTELSARKSFISQIRAEVRQMKSKTDIHNETIDMTEVESRLTYFKDAVSRTIGFQSLFIT